MGQNLQACRSHFIRNILAMATVQAAYSGPILDTFTQSGTLTHIVCRPDVLLTHPAVSNTLQFAICHNPSVTSFGSSSRRLLSGYTLAIVFYCMPVTMHIPTLRSDLFVYQKHSLEPIWVLTPLVPHMFLCSESTGFN